MAGAARYTAVLDACVLYPVPIRDLLLSLARAGLYQARWTEQIQDEWIRNLLANRPDLSAEKLNRSRLEMNTNIPDCLIANHEKIINAIELPDPGDRHVVAAAIVGHADCIVTFNLKHFPIEALQQYNLEAQHPDDFIMNQFELHQVTALSAVAAMRARLRKPPRTAEELIATLEKRELLMTAKYLRQAITLI
jgi:predicted nucleic acid-binding protein